jgi:hypothetical protein
MTPDGSTIVGIGTGADGFLWSPTGVTNFADLLAARGVDLTGWTAGEPRKLTRDGRYVFGDGTCGDVHVTYRLQLSE